MYKSAGIGYYTQMMLDGSCEIVPKVNLNSPKQLVDLLQHLGIRLKEKTDGGQYTTKSSVLSKVKRQHKFIPLLLEHRTISKLLNSFLNKLPKHIEGDNRIRCNWHNTVAVTGRLSSSNPAMQTLPKG
jgi:DNA polymerase-1